MPGTGTYRHPRGGAGCEDGTGASRRAPVGATVREVSTSVVLSVTPREPVEPDRWTGEVPADVAAALVARGQRVAPGLWRPHSGAVRLLFQLGGPDRVPAGQQLLTELRQLGYDADLSVSR